MKQYRLKKDLPGLKAGEILTWGQWVESWKYKPNYFPDWFEEVKEEKKDFDINRGCHTSDKLTIYESGMKKLLKGEVLNGNALEITYKPDKPDIDKFLLGLQLNKCCVTEPPKKELVLSDTEREIIEACRKAKDIDLNHFTLSKTNEKIAIWDEVTMPNFMGNCYLTGGTINPEQK